MALIIRPKQKLLFIGDSITDCGRRDIAATLGAGYVRMINDLIVAKYPRHQLNVINTGIGGNTVRELHDRWTDDVIRHQPHWLSVKIGINDLHRYLDGVPESVSPHEFAELYDGVLGRARDETKARLVLVDPFYMSTDRRGPGRRADVLKLLPTYIRTVHAMARKYRARLVETHQMFQQQLKQHHPDVFAPEPVHPNPTGHLLIAHAWLKTMGW